MAAKPNTAGAGGPARGARGVATKPATAPVKPRKPQTDESRAARAEYMRRYRSANGITEPPTVEETAMKPAGESPAQEGPSAEQTALAQAAATAAAEAATKARAKADAEAAAVKLARTESLLVEALAGTTQLLTDAVQLVALDSSKPHFGHKRATEVAKLWAPILAPYIDEKTAGHLPLVLALAGTSASVYSWAHEYSAATVKP